MEGTLAGKYVLVTGATSGMGKVAARQLAERGATVVLTGRNAEKTRPPCRRSSSASPGVRCGPWWPTSVAGPGPRPRAGLPRRLPAA